MVKRRIVSRKHFIDRRETIKEFSAKSKDLLSVLLPNRISKNIYFDEGNRRFFFIIKFSLKYTFLV